MIIAFEGIDGAGKNFLAERVASKLNLPLIEPLATEFGSAFKSAFQRRLFTPLGEVAGNAALYSSLLLEGDLIVVRYLISPAVYLNCLYQIDPEFFLTVMKFFGVKEPDFIVLVDAPDRVIKERVEGRGEEFDEKFAAQLRKAYLKVLYNFFPNSFMIVDNSSGDGAVENVCNVLSTML